MSLKENYKNYIPDSNGRKYTITTESGVSTIEDITTYTQVGDNFGANDINATNHAVNEMVSTVDEVADRLDSAAVITIPADDGTNYTEVLDPSTSAVMYYTIDIAVAGMTDDFVGTNAIDYVIPMTNGIVDIDLSDERAEAFSQRIGAWSQNGSIKFAFREKPTIDIPVYIYGL